ncbi:MAG: hypothetical protein NTW29_03905 [Bacteroidetes bacterium]|nr:hypothetical protein [Bacteroidota bacterium]
MQKRTSFLLVILLLAQLSFGQFDTSFARKHITRCTDSLVKGFRTQNWELFALYSNPAIIGTMGGKEAFINTIRETFAAIPASAWKSYKPGKVIQIIQLPRELQSVSELISVVEFQGRRVTATTYLIGQSWDGGLNWTFFDSQNDINTVREIKPDISPAIKLPPRKEKMERVDENGKIIPPPAKTPKKRSGNKKPG